MEDQERQELRELQDPENWDFGDDVILPPSASPGAVVAVRFRREEFARVATFARRRGMTTAAFIRWAALDHVTEAIASAAGSAPPNGDAAAQAVPIVIGDGAERGT